MKKEAFIFGLAGALIIFTVSTILASTGLGTSLGENEEILFFLQVASGLAAIIGRRPDTELKLRRDLRR